MANTPVTVNVQIDEKTLYRSMYNLMKAQVGLLKFDLKQQLFNAYKEHYANFPEDEEWMGGFISATSIVENFNWEIPRPDSQTEED